MADPNYSDEAYRRRAPICDGCENLLDFGHVCNAAPALYPGAQRVVWPHRLTECDERVQMENGRWYG